MVENIVYSAQVTPHGPKRDNETDKSTTNSQNNSITHTYSLRTRSTPDNRETPSTTLTEATSTTRDHDQTTSVGRPITNMTTMTYIGAAENFKARYRNHMKSFRNERYKKETELSKYVHRLQENNINYSIKWKIRKKTSGYNQITHLSNLCTSEKVEICQFRNKNLAYS